MLGYIFEKYINQKAFGAYYTRPEITEYLCERTIHRLILDAVNTPDVRQEDAGRRPKAREYRNDRRPADGPRRGPVPPAPARSPCRGMSLLDPACGSGAFLVAAMKTLINVYAAVVGKIKFLNDTTLSGLARQGRARATPA